MDEQAQDSLTTIAILVSRVDAVCLASMLRAYGIIVHISGDAHASVHAISLALGGHRLLVPAAQYQQASDLIRESGADQGWTFSRGVRKAVLRVFGWYFGVLFSAVMTGAIMSSIPWFMVLMTPVMAASSVPVNPQGKGDYYLADLLEPAAD